MAPEVIQHNSEYFGFKADLWSAGVCLYKMLIGQEPFRGNTVKDITLAVVKGDYGDLDGIDKITHSYKTVLSEKEKPLKKLRLSNEVKDLISRLLTKDPNDRISAEECL